MTHKASEGPRVEVRDKHNVEAFCNAVIDADGGWVEMEQSISTTSKLGSAVTMRIGTKVSEVSVHDGVIYARMRKGT